MRHGFKQADRAANYLLEHRLAFLVCLLCLVFDFAKAAEAEPIAAAEAELRALTEKVPSFRVITLPEKQGEVFLTKEDSLTVEQLRGLELDGNPPELGSPGRQYDRRMTDAFPGTTAPYVAAGIKPFRFRYFNCEFNYGGWHNFAMADYAATRGFNIIYPYTREIQQGTHLPRGTQWLNWGGFVNWNTWFGEHGLPDGRYDLLLKKDLVQLHLDEGKFDRRSDTHQLSQRADCLMIDMEHPVLSPEELRRQSWYPQNASESESALFEKRYYDGYAQTYISAVRAARKQGWRNVSLYGWAPYGRTWGGLEKSEVDPGSEDAWDSFGKQIYDQVDVINNSVYCFYWSPRNVAYTLANIDVNMALVNSMPIKKPVRPYYWTLLHGGGGGWRWWRGQPLANEETRAMIAMAFFTGIDGFDAWNWSGTDNHHVPLRLTSDKSESDDLTSGADLIFKDSIKLLPDECTGRRGAGAVRSLRRGSCHQRRRNGRQRAVSEDSSRGQRPGHLRGSANVYHAYPPIPEASARQIGTHCGHDRRHGIGATVRVHPASW